MYVLLLPSMYCLFNLLLHFRGKRRTGLRTISLIIYIIHPFMIVVIRLFAKLLHLQSLLVENSLVHYIAVCFASVVLAVVITALLSSLKPKKAKHTADTDRAYLEINLSCGNSYVLIGGRQAPIVGKICMDQLAVDVTDIPNVKTGSIATLIGKDGKEEITAPMVAESAESITNELLSRMGHRLNIIRRA